LKTLIVAVLAVVLLSVPALAGSDFPKPLKEAATREELVKDFGTTVGFGKVEKWEFTTAGHQLISFWYCPYSGRAVCYVHAYYYDREKHAWVLFIDRMLEPATRLSVEISADHVLVFKDRDGKVVVRESIESLPK
jgi:hypothetical protein